MQLNRLCCLLPVDSDEIEPYPKKERQKRSCSNGFTKYIHQVIHKLLELNWLHIWSYDYSPKKQHSGVFLDAAGIGFMDKVGGSNNPRIFSYSELYIGSNGFSEKEVLGSGGFGKVYKAVLPSDGTFVAVKCVAERGEQFEKTFLAELMAVANLRHRNLVRLRGWCMHDDELLLVYDYMPNQSLDRILFRRAENNNSTPLNWERRQKIVNGLAAALFYLHGQLETQIIHRDVKTSNVMLDSHYNARLGDFGLARWLEHELEDVTKSTARTATTAPIHNHKFRLGDTTSIGGTIGYLPPESFQKRSLATAKSDVFSFGIVVLEVVSGRRAVDLTYPDDQIILLDWIRRLSDEGKLMQAGDARLQDSSSSLLDMERLTHLGLLCTLHDPQLRPNMKWVVGVLSSNYLGKLPSLPSFHSHPLYISLSSRSNSSSTSNSTNTAVTTTKATTTSSTSASTNYATAKEGTIYVTAKEENQDVSSSFNVNYWKREFPVIETPREISFKELLAATDNFSDSRQVAELDFGTAYHGILDNHHHVLVKRLGMKTCPALRVRFANELENLGRLHHRNLVYLRGWCTENGEMLVVYDFSERRILSNLIFGSQPKNGGSVLQWQHRYNIVKSLASAILYLHEEWEEQVIHRNITSSAIVVDPDMKPRLCCFALAEFLTRNEHSHHVVVDTKRTVRGIFGYIAPEYMESGKATTSADIYSFGVVALEVVTGQRAVDFSCPQVLLVKKVQDFEARKKPLEELVDRRLDGEYDIKELQRLARLGLACTRSKPELRPSMRQILNILDGHDACFNKKWKKKEKREEWQQRNGCSLALVRRIQALGIQ
ncbi:Serine-threonine/tyrosine-protein kinase, catalytic domain [Dillenia turbinata]|uniref:Serine-threonine/tyrosine-protein kinase, catalytic domain n=1 Tax=Dillenia turbinata TaxID=194707 RepID=A0AAN8VDG9_9MAGN